MYCFRYAIYANGDFPFGKMATKISDEDIKLPSIDDKVKDFIKFENKLYGDVRLLKKMNKKKRKKFLKMGNSDDNNRQISSNYKKKKLSEWDETEVTENVDLYSNLSSNNNKETFSVSTEASINSNSIKKKNKKKRKNENVKNINKIDQNETAAASVSTKNIETVPRTFETDIKNVKSNNGNKQNNNDTLLNKENDKLPMFSISDEWSKPLEVGEIEYYVPSKKVQVEQANKIFIKNQNDDNKLVLNPFAIQSNSVSSNKKVLIRAKNRRLSTPVIKSIKSTKVSSPLASSEKRVKFMLQLNKVQDTNEYIRQLRSSPQLPYDSKKVPAKGVLKPNLMPSPINPFYRRNIGLHLNDTF